MAGAPGAVARRSRDAGARHEAPVTAIDGEPGRLDGLDRTAGRRGGPGRARALPRSWPSAPGARSSCWPSRPGCSDPTWWPSATPTLAAALAAAGARRAPRSLAGPDGLRRRSPGAATSWSTAWSGSPGCRSRWPRSSPGAGWPWPTRSRSSPARRSSSGPGATPGAEIVPVDSEHCALHQCLPRRATVGPTRWPRLVLTASGGPFRGRTRAELAGGRRRRGAGASDLADGTEDHRRLVHSHEQGPRGHRGPRAVRHRLRPDRRRRPPPVGRPLDGRVRSTGPPWPSCPCPTCACPSATPWATPSGCRRPFGAIDWSALEPLDFEPPDRDAVRLPRPGRARPGRPAGPPRRGSTRPTRWRWPPSSTGGLGVGGHRRGGRRHAARPASEEPIDTVDDVLEADRRARERAEAGGRRREAGRRERRRARSATRAPASPSGTPTLDRVPAPDRRRRRAPGAELRRRRDAATPRPSRPARDGPSCACSRCWPLIVALLRGACDRDRACWS